MCSHITVLRLLPLVKSLVLLFVLLCSHPSLLSPVLLVSVAPLVMKLLSVERYECVVSICELRLLTAVPQLSFPGFVVDLLSS